MSNVTGFCADVLLKSKPNSVNGLKNGAGVSRAGLRT